MKFIHISFGINGVLKNVILPLIFLGCSTLPQGRRLSDLEMQKYNLNGIINEVKICPTVFDEKLKASRIIGTCDVVSCYEEDKQIICVATPDKPLK